MLQKNSLPDSHQFTVILLDQLQTLLDPRKFFRINRECIVNIEAIALIYSFSSSRLQLTLKDKEKSDLFVVSRDKVAEFKRWIDK